MPTIGPFHRFYWRARANTPPPAGTAPNWSYPRWQSVPRGAVTLSMAIWGVPFDVLGPLWAQLRWYLRLARRLWNWRAPANQAQLETWIARLEELDAEQIAVLDRVLASVTGPCWDQARAAVRVCATTPKFHQMDQWIDYGRAIKANPGQAQNVYRHLKVVQELRGLADDVGGLSNPDAHLLAELAYQGMAAIGRARRHIDHKAIA